jgi:hypothetical protein
VNSLPSPEASSVPFLKTDVTSWKEQVALFKAAQEKYGKIDHVFANAGIGRTFTLLEDDVDENGDLLPPNLKTMNVNLTGCMYTVKLGIYYLKKNENGGSIVMTASASSFHRFPATDYSTSYSKPRPSLYIYPLKLISTSNKQTCRTRPPSLSNPSAPSRPAHPHQRHRTLLDRHQHCAQRDHRRVRRGQLPVPRCRWPFGHIVDGGRGEAWRAGV